MPHTDWVFFLKGRQYHSLQLVSSRLFHFVALIYIMHPSFSICSFVFSYLNILCLSRVIIMSLSPFYEIGFKTFTGFPFKTVWINFSAKSSCMSFTCNNSNPWCNGCVEYLRSLLYSILSNLFGSSYTFSNKAVLQDPNSSIPYTILEYKNE